MVRNCEMCPEDRAVLATMYCAADACYLCAKCDADVHNANRLAQRHVRTPVAPCDMDGSSIHDESEEALVPEIRAMHKDDTDALTFEDAADYDFTELGLGRMPGLAGVEEIGIWGEGKLGRNWEVSWEEVVQDGFVHVVPEVEPRADKAADEGAHADAAAVDASKQLRLGAKRAAEQQHAADAEEELKAVERRRKRRKEALERFRSKRANRSFAKRVRYECRKQLADSRPRVKGRFVRKVEMALYRKYGNMYREHLHELESSAGTC